MRSISDVPSFDRDKAIHCLSDRKPEPEYRLAVKRQTCKLKWSLEQIPYCELRWRERHGLHHLQVAPVPSQPPK